MQILHDLSLFPTKITGAPHSDMLGHIILKSNNSFNFIFNSCTLGVDIRYDNLEIGHLPGFISILNFDSLFGGKPDIS